jgi:RNA polymerase sigma factor (sigma-70 family)
MRRYVAWPPPDELIRLVRATQEEDPRALDELLRALRPALLAYFAYRLSDDSAEDLTQVALMRIARAVSRIAPERADRYITTIARNLLRTAYRRRRRDELRRAPADVIEAAESQLAADLDTEYAELTEAIRQVAATALPVPLGRIVLGLLRGKTPIEIATAEHVNPTTIRTRLLRARAVLRRELRMYIDPGAPGINGNHRACHRDGNTAERYRKCRGM